jgi:maltose O-acetyltransferase
VKTEKEKMLDGDLYDSSDPELVKERLLARDICFRLNSLSPEKLENERQDITEQLFGIKTDVFITPPFRCDYGKNISIGTNVYFNFNCIVLDVAIVKIGSNVLFGPGVQILTATHPTNAIERREGLELGKSIEIGNDVWIGGGAILCPGVKVGDGAIIGAGSVVTRDVAEDTVSAGNPCKVIRKLT